MKGAGPWGFILRLPLCGGGECRELLLSWGLGVGLSGLLSGLQKANLDLRVCVFSQEDFEHWAQWCRHHHCPGQDAGSPGLAFPRPPLLSLWRTLLALALSFLPRSPMAAMLAKYWMTRFVFTVFPAPDSPLEATGTHQNPGFPHLSIWSSALPSLLPSLRTLAI